jgi:hypothetical protein
MTTNELPSRRQPALNEPSGETPLRARDAAVRAAHRALLRYPDRELDRRVPNLGANVLPLANPLALPLSHIGNESVAVWSPIPLGNVRGEDPTRGAVIAVAAFPHVYPNNQIVLEVDTDGREAGPLIEVGMGTPQMGTFFKNNPDLYGFLVRYGGPAESDDRERHRGSLFDLVVGLPEAEVREDGGLADVTTYINFLNAAIRQRDGGMSFDTVTEAYGHARFALATARMNPNLSRRNSVLLRDSLTEANYRATESPYITESGEADVSTIFALSGTRVEAYTRTEVVQVFGELMSGERRSRATRSPVRPITRLLEADFTPEVAVDVLDYGAQGVMNRLKTPQSSFNELLQHRRLTEIMDVLSQSTLPQAAAVLFDIAAFTMEPEQDSHEELRRFSIGALHAAIDGSPRNITGRRVEPDQNNSLLARRDMLKSWQQRFRADPNFKEQDVQVSQLLTWLDQSIAWRKPSQGEVA